MRKATLTDINNALSPVGLGLSALEGTDLEGTSNQVILKRRDDLMHGFAEVIPGTSQPASEAIVEEPVTPEILLSPGTPLACTNCHRMGMPVYYLKRNNGKYSVLCFENGKGCWERSSRSTCSYVDGDAQCMDLAEFAVQYGTAHQFTQRCVCGRHVPTALSGASEYRVYPLDVEFAVDEALAVRL